MSRKSEFDIAEEYVQSPDFTITQFIEDLKKKSKMDMATYLMMFTHLLHKDDFFLDLAIFQATGKSGQREQDIQEDKKHLLIEYIEAAKKEDMDFISMSLGSLMPIRYYFPEIYEFAIYYNDLLDASDISPEEKRRNKFLEYELEKMK